MFEAFDASASALRSERVRLTVIANNLANTHTTRNEYGEREAFRRKLVVFKPGNEENANPRLGVDVDEIVSDNAAPQLVYDPTHPDRIRPADLFEAGKDGKVTTNRLPKYAKLSEEEWGRELRKIDYVEYPNVDPVKEFGDAVLAARAYEANVTVVEVSKRLLGETLSIIA